MTRIVSNVRPWLHSLRQQRWPNSNVSMAYGVDRDDDHGLPSLADSHDTRLNEAFSTMMMSSAKSGGDSKSTSRPSTLTTTETLASDLEPPPAIHQENVRLRAIVENVVKENQKQLSEKLTNDAKEVTPAANDEQAAESGAFPPAQSSSFGALRTLIYSVLPDFVSTSSTESSASKTKLEAGKAAKQPAEAAPKKPAPVTKTLTREQRIAQAKEIIERREQVEKRAVMLVKKLRTAESTSSRVLNMEQLANHLMNYPLSTSICIDAGLESLLLLLQRQAHDSAETAMIRVCLSLIGRVHKPKGTGVRILAIDGGGTRGMMSLQILEALESHLEGRRIHECFDLMVGVSTGAIITMLIGAFQLPVTECRRIYRDMSSKLFTRARLSGVSSLLWSHSYYDTPFWVRMLKDIVTDKAIMDLVREKEIPQLCAVSCVVNTAKLEPFLFRNYALPLDGRQSSYAGASKYKLWQALQASAAAPGYFDEVHLDGLVHQDGGVLVNNPTCIGIGEARSLWPNEQLQCVLSIGNGRSMPAMPTVDGTMRGLATSQNASVHDTLLHGTSLTDKIVKIVDSATDTESELWENLVHRNVSCLLDPHIYYRLNPYMTHMYTLDEIEPERLEQMQNDAQMYIRRNTPKMKALASTLLATRTRTQQTHDFVETEALRRFNYKWR